MFVYPLLHAHVALKLRFKIIFLGYFWQHFSQGNGDYLLNSDLKKKSTPEVFYRKVFPLLDFLGKSSHDFASDFLHINTAYFLQPGFTSI